ncbi:MAG: hypothetical protein IPH06_08780 [Alphaproteobacteria bacterium]|jgi:hypothetical protein|nr:hypothetical protein [Alphaproteobacteria bacterium]QQS58095.1 MAG: hypothetical protein IPN28_04540 [Alphaproteobacteria bacterium]
MCGSLLTRRLFMQMTASATVFLGGQMFLPNSALASPGPGKRYKGPNVIVIRYGGGVRRRETIEPETSFSPFMLNRMIPKGTLYRNMSIAELPNNETDHAQGTVNIMTGRYFGYTNHHEKIPGNFLRPSVPSIFEYLREAYALDAHEALIINGEDRAQDDGFHMHLDEKYASDLRPEMLSPTRFRAFLLQVKLEQDTLTSDARSALEEQLTEVRKQSPEFLKPSEYSPELQNFWRKWRSYYGDDNLKHPRGDRQTTELALWSLRYLRPKLLMVNYQDPDYVHFGIKSHYTRAISVIDQGIQSIVTAAESDPFYRDNTVFVIVPDCGRDSNPLMDVPFQHHFNSRSSHEIFAVLYGSGIANNRIVETATDQTSIAPTVAALMGFKAEKSEGVVLKEALL